MVDHKLMLRVVFNQMARDPCSLFLRVLGHEQPCCVLLSNLEHTRHLGIVDSINPFEQWSHRCCDEIKCQRQERIDLLSCSWQQKKHCFVYGLQSTGVQALKCLHL